MTVNLQRSLVAVETDKEKLETDLLKQQEKSEMLQSQVEKSQKDRQNLQAEMEILLDRINKLSDMLDKARVSPRLFAK
jgi:septal ring factor EnvC (AmiA/AmiB activator)